MNSIRKSYPSDISNSTEGRFCESHKNQPQYTVTFILKYRLSIKQNQFPGDITA